MLESLKSKNSDVVTVVELRGRLDSTTSRDFEAFFEEMTRTGKRAFVLGVRDLEYVSSAGMAVLVRFLRSVEDRRGVIILVNPHSELRLLLQFFQLDKRLVVKETIEEAKAHALALLPGESSLEIRRSEEIRPAPVDVPSGVRSAAERPVPPASITKLGEHTTWPRPIFQDDSRTAAAPSASAWMREPGEPALGLHTVHAGPGSDPGLAEVEAQPDYRPQFRSGAARLPGEGTTGVSAAEEDFREPVILECEQCRTQVRVYRPGQHMCPSCRITFRVRKDATASFQEKFRS